MTGAVNNRGSAGSLIAITIGAGLIFAGMYGIISSGIPSMALDSFGRHIARAGVAEAKAEKIGRIYKDEAYATVCPTYFNASWIKKHTTFRGKAWCEDYADKM